MTATMQRRILVNYRVDPDILASLLPEPFRPAVVGGFGVAGICLIRLGHIRPSGWPASLGLTSENVAHRVAVEWPSAHGTVTGVYIPRRDTSSTLTAVLGGRAFPGWHHRAHFDVEEREGSYRVEMSSRDGATKVIVATHRADAVMADSIFGDVAAASAFFRCAPVGYSATPRPGIFDGVALATKQWAMAPLQIDEAKSSFFADPARFPLGTATLDSAFLMANVDTTWQPLPEFSSANEIPR
jgi:hypothetical protein